MSLDRRAVRTLAMQTLCQWEVQQDESIDAGNAVADLVAASGQAAAAARGLTQVFWSDREAIDRRISAVAEKWDLQRLAVVDRNVLRVAVVEMLSGEVPPKVALDEAIEIAKEYGGADSPRFVNGVLDAVLRKMQAEIGAPPPTRGGEPRNKRLETRD